MSAMTIEDPGDSQMVEQRRRFSWWRAIRWAAIQLYPYGRDHSNPPVTQVIQWDSPRTEALFNDACADCQTNETDWSWYSNVAPVSWLVQRDVDHGREEFNISEPGGMEEAGEAAETVQDGSMPLWYYTITHSNARLSDAEEQELINGLLATFGSEDEEDDD